MEPSNSMKEISQDLAAAIARVEEQPGDEERWDVLDEAARREDCPEPVSATYRRVLAQSLEPTLAFRLGKRAVAFHEEWYEDPSLAVDILKPLSIGDDEGDWAFEHLSLLLTMAERWSELLSEYDRKLAHTADKDRRMPLLDEAARIAKDFAGEGERASAYLKELLLSDPDNDQLADSLERRLEQQQRHRDLIDVWTARLTCLDEPLALQTRVRIADRHLTALNDPQAALAVAEDILEVGGGEDDACQLLERLAFREQEPQEPQRRALAVLRDRYAAADRAEDVVRVLDRFLAVSDGNAQRRELHADCVRWLTRLEKHEDALEHGAELLRLTPESSEVHEQLRGLAELTGRQDRYARALVAAAEACPAEARRIAMLVEAGHVFEREVGEAESATSLYLRVLDDASADADARLRVARRLRQLLSEAENLPRLLETLESLSRLEPEEAGQREVIGEAAKLAYRLDDVDRSLALWQRCLEVSAGDLTALDERINILERAERWEALIEDLRERARRTEKHGPRRADLSRVARIYETRLFRLESAIEVWREVEEQFGRNAQTVDALVDLCAAAHQVDDVIALLTAAIEVESDPMRKTDQLARLGDVYREGGRESGSAVEHYAQALELSATHEGARSGLRALLDHPECGPVAVETLASSLREADEWPGVLELVELRVAASESVEARYAILLEAADILERRAQDPGGALAYACRAFELDPNPELETEVTRLANTSGEWSTAVSGYTRAIHGAQEGERKQALCYRRGQIFETELEDLDAALESYRLIASSQPGHDLAASAIASVAIRLRAWDDLADVFVRHSMATGHVSQELAETVARETQTHSAWQHVTEATLRRIDAGTDLDAQVAHDLNRQLAFWYRDHRTDPEVAIRLLSTATHCKPAAETLQALAELQRARPGRPLVETLLLLAKSTEDDLDVLSEAATVALESVGDPALAAPILERTRSVAGERLERLAKESPGETLGSAPDRVAWWSIAELERLTEARGDHQGALSVLMEGAQLPFDEDRKIELWFRAAAVAVRELGDPDRAIDICRRVRSVAPEHEDAIGLLGSIYEEGERYEELLALRNEELSLEPPLDRRLFLRLDEARIRACLGEGKERRVAALELNVEECPGHEASIDELSAILSEAQEHQNLRNLLTEQAKQLAAAGERPERAATLWARAGQLSETHLGDVDAAVDAYEASIALHETAEVLDALAALCAGRSDHPGAVGWLEQRLTLTDDDDRLARRSTLVRLSTSLCATGEHDRARAHLSEGLRRDPEGSDMRELLAEIYRKREDWQQLATLLSAGVEYASDEKEQVEYLRDAAYVQRTRLGQLEEAIPLLQRAVELTPDDRSLRLSLADGLREAQRFDEARALLEKLLVEFGRRRTPERARVHYQLAQIARSTGDLDRALRELDLASKVDRNNMPMLKLLGDVAREKGQLEDAERAYRTLLLLLGRSKPRERDADGGIAEGAILFELHRIASELGQTERAADLLDSALEAAAHDDDEAQRLERALQESGNDELLLRALDQRRARTQEPRALGEISSSRAEVLERMGQLAAALDCQIEALENDPSATERIRDGWRLATQLGAVDRVSDTVSRRARAVFESQPELSCELWLTLGELSEGGTDGAHAASCYREAQKTGIAPLRSFEAIERVGIDGDPEALAEALGSFVNTADPADSPEKYTEALYRLGALELYQKQTEDAAAHIENALDRDGDSRKVLDLLRSSLSSAPPAPSLVGLLERVSRDLSDDKALLLSLTHAARLGCAPLETLREASDLASADGDDSLQRELLEATVERARSEGRTGEAIWAVHALAKLLERLGDPAAAVELLEGSVSDVGSDDGFELQLRAAGVARGPLEEPKKAAAIYEALLAQEPTDARVWRPLFDVYRSMGNRQKLEKRISELEAAVDDPAVKSSLYIERMRILIDSDRKQEAEQSLKELLEREPASEEASELLEELLESEGRLSEMHSLIEERLVAARQRGDQEAITTRTLRLGKILSERDRDAALALYRESFEYAGESRRLLESFLSLLDPQEHEADRAFALYQLVALDSGVAAEQRALELVALQKARHDQPGVERALERGLSRVPSSDALHDARVAWFGDLEAWEPLARALCEHANRITDPALAAEKIEQAAAIYEERLGDPRCAAETLELAVDPTRPDPNRLARIARSWSQAGEPQRALDHLNRAIEIHSEPGESLATLLHLRGSLRLQRETATLRDLSACISDLEAAARIAPEGVLPDLAAALERRLGALRAEGEREHAGEIGSSTLSLSRVLAKLGQLDAAAQRVGDWVADHPDDKAAQMELGKLAGERGDWSTAAEAYRGLVRLSEGDEQVNVALELAEACERAGDPLAARDVLEQVYERVPGQESLRQRLRQMYESAKEYRAWAAMLVADAGLTEDEEERFRLLNDAGDLYLQLEEPALSEAKHAFEQALAIRDDAGVLVKLVDTQVRLDQIETAAGRLDEAIRKHGKRRSPELSHLQHAMAKVAEAAGDEEAIFAWLEAALYSDRQNGVVAAELAALAMARGEFDVAIKALQLVTLLKTPGPMSRAEAYLRQAAIAKHRGDTKKSALLAKRAVTTDPEYADAKSFLDDLLAPEAPPAHEA